MSIGALKFHIESSKKVLFINVSGRATFEIAYKLEKFCFPFLERSYHLEIDFSDTVYLDSTFLGIMALFTRKSVFPVLVCNASDDVFNYFKVLNIHTYFEFVKRDFPNKWNNLPEITEKNSALIMTIIEAHEELIHKGSKDSKKFKTLVKSLKENLN